MATIDEILNPITSKREAQYRSIYKVLTGVDVLRIKGGFNLEVPQHWALSAVLAKLTTDATVANRAIVVNHSVAGRIMGGFQSQAIAATTTGYLVIASVTNLTNVTPSYGTDLAGIGDEFGLISGLDDFVQFKIDTGKAGDEIEWRIVFKSMNEKYGIENPELFDKEGYPK